MDDWACGAGIKGIIAFDLPDSAYGAEIKGIFAFDLPDSAYGAEIKGIFQTVEKAIIHTTPR